MYCQKAKGTGNGTPGFTGTGFNSLWCPADYFDMYMKAPVINNFIFLYLWFKCYMVVYVNMLMYIIGTLKYVKIKIENATFCLQKVLLACRCP